MFPVVYAGKFYSRYDMDVENSREVTEREETALSGVDGNRKYVAICILGKALLAMVYSGGILLVVVLLKIGSDNCQCLWVNRVSRISDCVVVQVGGKTVADGTNCKSSPTRGRKTAVGMCGT